jgi:ATP-binding protein involved in chromosome partitioning
MCRDYDVEFLGSLPLDIRIREQADSGKPTVVSDPEGPIAAIYRDIARKVAARIARAGRGPHVGVSQDRHPEQLID